MIAPWGKVALAAKSMPRSGEAYKAASWYFRTGWMLGYIDTLHRLQRADLASRAAEWEADTTPMIAAGEAIAPGGPQRAWAVSSDEGREERRLSLLAPIFLGVNDASEDAVTTA